jgi:hypothetical protein
VRPSRPAHHAKIPVVCIQVEPHSIRLSQVRHEGVQVIVIVQVIVTVQIAQGHIVALTAAQSLPAVDEDIVGAQGGRRAPA